MKAQKSLKTLLIFICACALLLTGCRTSQNTSASTQAQTYETEFAELTEEIFRNHASSDTLTLNYTLKDPASYGIEMEEVTWGEVPLSEEVLNEEKAEIKNYLDRLNQISGLEGNDAVTYDVLKYYLEKDLESYDYIYNDNTFAPLIGFPSQFPITMSEYHFDDSSDVEDYLALLKDFPDYIDQLLKFESQKSEAGYGMCRSALEQSIKDCEAFLTDTDNNVLISVFPEKLEEVSGLSEDEKNSYIEKNKETVTNSVIPAYQSIIQGLNSQINSAPENGSLSAYDNGKDYYKYLLKTSVGTDKTPEELIEMTEKKLGTALFTLGLIMNNNPDIFDQIENSNYAYTDPTEIIEHFKSTFTAEQMPEAPQAEYTLKTVPESLSDSLSPAMYFIPRIDDTKNNQIYLNITENTGNPLMPTLAHEGYPGHMYQYIYYYNTNPNPVRTVYTCSGYVEGWAAYVEGLSYNYCGFSEDIADYYSAYMSDFILNLYCRLDLGIHYEGWRIEEAGNFIKQYLNADDDIIQEIYNSIVFNPTNYLIYGIGMDEIQELRSTMEKNLDENFDIKTFHKELLDLGPAPFPIIRKYMTDAQPAETK